MKLIYYAVCLSLPGLLLAYSAVAQTYLTPAQAVKTLPDYKTNADLNTVQNWGDNSQSGWGMYMFNTKLPINAPADLTDGDRWMHIIEMQHVSNSDYSGQIGLAYFQDGGLYWRQHNGSSWRPWLKAASEQWVNQRIASGSFLPLSGGTTTGDVHVTGNVVAKTDAAINGFVQLWGDNALIWKNGNYNNGLRFGTSTGLNAENYSQKMIITDQGNVGIGSANPTSPLTIAANVPDGVGILKVSGTEPDILFDDIDGGYNTFTFLNAGNPKWAFGRDISDNFYFTRNNGGTWYDNTMVIKGGSGNVGIGTLNPADLLSVNGTISSRRVKVTQIGWADYVFDPSYKLLPLKAVATFIQANKHLPSIPSATTIEKEGLDIGDIQKLMMQKIEELTLYIIAQDKKIDNLQIEMKELRTQVH